MRTTPAMPGRPRRSAAAPGILMALLIIATPAPASLHHPATPAMPAADDKQVLHENHERGEEIGRGLRREFIRLYERGQFPQALAVAKRAHALVTRLHGAEHIDNADPLLKLGIIHQTLGHLDRAREHFEHSLRILQDNHSRDRPHMAITLTNLGSLYFELGDYRASERAHQRALALRRAAFGPLSAEAAQSLYNLGVLYEHQQDYARAARQYQRAIELWSATLGSNHPFIDNTRRNLARVHLARQRTLQHHALSATLAR